MTASSAALRSTFTDLWPEHAWETGVQAQGAFHDVIVVAPDVVGRRSSGEAAYADAHREATNLLAVAQGSLPVQIPTLLGGPTAVDDAWCTLTSWVAGQSVSELQTLIPGRIRAYTELLDAFRNSGVQPELLPQPRSWCGGEEFPIVVQEELATRLQPAERATAEDVVSAMLDAEAGTTATFCHGDFGPHNILWRQGTAVSLIDFDHACWGDPAIDIAPLIGFHSAGPVRALCDAATLDRAKLHRATLSLQVASAAHLRGLTSLRDHMLASFTKRVRGGTLHDPAGT